MKFQKHIAVLFILFTTSLAYAQVTFESNPDSDDLKKEIFIITEVSKTNVSVSDSIVVKYKLYVSQSTGVEGWSEVEKPVYKDFYADYIISNNVNITNKKYKGEKYRAVVIREVVLKPNEKGNFELPKYALDIEIYIPSKIEGNEFGRHNLEKQKISIETDKINVTVK